MLALTRKQMEKIRIGDDIVVTLVWINGDRARIGIEAPRNMKILREELYAADKRKADSQLLT